MHPSNLTPGKQYQYNVLNQPMLTLVYRYKTLNRWFFETTDYKPFYLHDQQVLINVTEIQL